MSDQFDSLFTSLRGQSPPAPFAPATAVRRRGRQRAHRQAVSAGVAVLAVTGLGAGGAVTVFGWPGTETLPPPAATAPGTETGPATTAPASPTTPTRTEIPAQWLLTADDLGPGDWVTGGFEPERFESDPPWLFAGFCPDFRADDYPSLASRLDLQTVTWTDGPWEGEGDSRPIPNWVDQVVELFQPGAATTNLQDIQAAVDGCAVPGVRYEVVDSGFAGDESLLVAERYEGDVHVYTAVVRVGDAVTSLRSYDVELARADEGYLRSVAETAATRIR